MSIKHITVRGARQHNLKNINVEIPRLDFGFRQIVVRDGKGGKDHFTILPTVLIEPLQKQNVAKLLFRCLTAAQKMHEYDLRRGLGRVEMPFALARKYPNTVKEWSWQYVFPSRVLSKNPRTDSSGRHHLSPSGLQKVFKNALGKSRIARNARPLCAIRSPPTCFKTITTFAPFRNFSDTRNSRRQ